MTATLIDAVSFTAQSAGTGAFVFGSRRTSYLTPTQAVNAGTLSNGQLVSYAAVDNVSSPTQREWGRGTWSVAGQSLARTTVIGTIDSNGTVGGGAPLSFVSAPVVSFCVLSEDFDASFNVKQFGAKGDGVTDDTAAIQATLNAASSAGGGRVLLPFGTYVTSSTIIIPSGVAFEGVAFRPHNAPQGSIILGGALLNPVVQLGTSSNIKTASLYKVVVSRSGTNPSSSLDGILVFGYAAILEDVMAYNHGNGFHFQGVSHEGLAAMMTRCYSGAISGAHVIQDAFPELRLSQCRFGMDGNGDYASDCFLRLQGAVPNTLDVVNCQFDQGSIAVNNWLEFVNFSGVTQGAHYRFTDCHIENLTGAYITSDASWTHCRSKNNATPLSRNANRH